MSSEEPKYLSAEELKNAKITKDQLDLVKAFQRVYPKPKAKAKKSSGSTGGKKTEEQLVLGRLTAGAVNSKNKLNAETDATKKTEALKKRKDAMRKDLSAFLQQTDFKEEDVTKVVKSSMAVLLDVHVPTPPKTKPDSKPEQTSSQQSA